ncbi:MAG: aminoacyl-histidine dipeptidase [Bacteroidales bacterium]|nr:aminoacyl-histidine dipeptidase [Bacteroidales bacterium]
MSTIAELNPQIVWKNFYELTKIPRPSKFESEAAKYICDFGKNLGLESFQDEIGNVIIRKPATPGMEDRMGIILQAHVDMVPQKNNDVEHDFKKDPIKPRIVDDMVYATGTTLGADNGLGCAVAMAVLESKELVHGPIEVLITIDEETGMTGARALKPGVLNGDILINLDSETEGELYVGCAGGLDCSAVFNYTTEAVPAGCVGKKLNVKGLVGGHSGMDIILYRANANKVMVRALLPLVKDLGAKLISVEGGNMRNAIPREAEAVIAIPADKVAEAEAVVAKVCAEVKVEYAATDKDANVYLEDAAVAGEAICQDVAVALCRALYVCPNGVERMSNAMPGLVETSNNMAIVKSENGTIKVHSLMRSSVDTAKDDLAVRMRAAFELAGAEVSFAGGYSGWAPNMASPILREMKAVYEKLYGKQPAVMAIHAGLECGILGGTYPNWDMVSCGPTIFSPHSPDERVNIESVGKWWEFVKEVLKEAPKK